MPDLLWITSSSFLAALSRAVAPGPVFALVASESIKNSKIAGPLIVFRSFYNRMHCNFDGFYGPTGAFEIRRC